MKFGGDYFVKPKAGNEGIGCILEEVHAPAIDGHSGGQTRQLVLVWVVFHRCDWEEYRLSCDVRLRLSNSSLHMPVKMKLLNVPCRVFGLQSQQEGLKAVLAGLPSTAFLCEPTQLFT